MPHISIKIPFSFLIKAITNLLNKQSTTGTALPDHVAATTTQLSPTYSQCPHKIQVHRHTSQDQEQVRVKPPENALGKLEEAETAGPLPHQILFRR